MSDAWLQSQSFVSVVGPVIYMPMNYKFDEWSIFILAQHVAYLFYRCFSAFPSEG